MLSARGRSSSPFCRAISTQWNPPYATESSQHAIQPPPSAASSASCPSVTRAPRASAQDEDEWVVLLVGSAALAFADGRVLDLCAGNWTSLPARCRHRVEIRAGRRPVAGGALPRRTRRERAKRPRRKNHQCLR